MILKSLHRKSTTFKNQITHRHFHLNQYLANYHCERLNLEEEFTNNNFAYRFVLSPKVQLLIKF